MKKLTSICLALVLIISAIFLLPAIAAYEQSTEIGINQSEYDNDLNKLHFYFSKASDTESEIATCSVDEAADNDYSYIDSEQELSNALSNMRSSYERTAEENEPVKITVEFKSGFENTTKYKNLSRQFKTVKTIDELHDLRSELNAYSKEYHKTENEKNVKALIKIDCEDINILGYSPFVELSVDEEKINASELIELANSDKVANVCLSLEEEIIDEATWDRTMKEIGAYDIIANGTYTGDRINVGVWEAESVCDLERGLFNELFSDNNITINPEIPNVNVQEHGTIVTYVVSAMAPDANYFVSYNDHDDDEPDYYTETMDWLLEQNCDIINCSWGYVITDEVNGIYEVNNNKLNYRYNLDGRFDYISRVNHVIFVKSAGNVGTDNTKPGYNPNGYITSPGYGHNVITVGGLDCNSVLFDYELEHRDLACYKTGDGRTKPDISAIASLKIPTYLGEKSGTSYAAPQVTAAVAMLYEACLAIGPEEAKAVLMASAQETEGYANSSNTYLDDKVGAGCLNVEGMFDALSGTRMKSFSEIYNQSTPNDFIMTNTKTVNANDVIQVSVCSTAVVDNMLSQTLITNYDLYLYDPDNILVATSTLGENETIDFIRHKATKSGTYTAKVYQNGELLTAGYDTALVFTMNVV